MKMFRVTQTDTIVFIYEVEAENEAEAEQKILCGKGHLPEYDKTIDRRFEFEILRED